MYTTKPYFCSLLVFTRRTAFALLAAAALATQAGGRDKNNYGYDPDWGPPTYSGPIALSPDDRYVCVVNPDNNSVSLLEVGGGANRKIVEVPVGEEPASVAVTADGAKVYVTNRRSGTASMIVVARYQYIKTI